MTILPERLDLVKELVKPGTVGAEIGVYRGGFSRQIFDACQPAKLFCIDAWEPYKAYELDSLCHTNQPDNMEATKALMAAEISAGKCEVIKGYSSMVAKGWPTPMDFLFLDSNHSFDFVLEDLIAWHRHIKDGGVIMCHDFTETSAGAIAMKFGVVRAVAEFCTAYGWEVTHITQEPDWPSCAIRRK